MTGMCPKKAVTCKEWLQLVSEKGVCVCVCACSAHVLSVIVYERKKISINTLGWFRFHDRNEAARPFIYSLVFLLQDYTQIFHQLKCYLPLRFCLYFYMDEYLHVCMRERKKSVTFTRRILSKNKTNTLPMPSNHPPCSANIQAKLHSATSPSQCLSLT